MIGWLRALPPPLRYLIYLVGALVAFFVALGVGATAAVMDDLQLGWGASGPSENTGPETTDATEAPEGSVEGASFIHETTRANSRGDYTYISDPGIDGDPNAVVIARPAPDQPGPAYDHNVGVWYESGAEQWAIFNQDRTPVPVGTAFEVVLPPESASFVHEAALLNIIGNSTYLDDGLTNGEPEAVVSVTQNWNPGGGDGVYNDHPVATFYDEDVDRWAVYNRDDAPMPEGASFNVYVTAADAGEPAR